MSEYDLVCDACGRPLPGSEGLVSWTADGDAESGFALTHAGCRPAAANADVVVHRLASPNEYLRFVTDRFGKRIADTASLAAIVSGLAPFVMRPDNAAEMDGMRAASFGATPGVKPGTLATGVRQAQTEVESGK